MPWLNSLVALVIFGCVACGDKSAALDDSGEDSGVTGSEDFGAVLECEEADVEHTLRLAEIARKFASCTVDADCKLVDPVLTCADTGASIDGCPHVIARAKTDEFEQAALDLASELCARITPGCHAVGLCPASQAHCVDQRCTQGYEEPWAVGMLLEPERAHRGQGYDQGGEMKRKALRLWDPLPLPPKRAGFRAR